MYQIAFINIVSNIQNKTDNYKIQKFNIQFVAFERSTMHKIQQNYKVFPLGRKTRSVKSVQITKRSKNSNRNKEVYNKIPYIINQLQQNIKLLRKCYQQQQLPQTINLKCISKRPNRPLSSSNKSKNKTNHINLQDEAGALAEIDDLKKSFLNMYGYNTNNVVQLYNFYKKNLEKSTRLCSSTLMSNAINLTQNHSQIRDKGVRPSTALALSIEQPSKQKQSFKAQSYMLPMIQNTKKTNEMVNVANLLADKKKISRKNICENMNNQNLLMQAKKKLYRPNPNQNIQNFNKIKQKQNCRNQNIRISPSRKIKNYQNNKQKSSQKDKLRKQAKPEFINKSQEGKEILKSIQRQSIIVEKIELEKSQKKIIIQNSNDIEQKYQNLLTLDKPKVEKQKQGNQNKQLKSAKSSRSIKSIKSPNSIKSPSLNQAILLDITGSCQASQQKKYHQPSYFIPKVHTNPHDSLLDCEITPKQQSKILDLQSIPFDF